MKVVPSNRPCAIQSDHGHGHGHIGICPTHDDEKIEDEKQKGLVQEQILLLQRLAQLERTYCDSMENSTKEIKRQGLIGEQLTLLRIGLAARLEKEEEEAVVQRVLVPIYKPQAVVTSDTIGAWFMGSERYGALYHLLYKAKGGWLSIALILGYLFGVVLYFLQLVDIVSYTAELDLLCGVCMSVEILMYTLDMNHRVCSLLLSRFEVWFGVFNSLVLNFSLMALFGGQKHSWSILLGWTPSTLSVWFTDAIEPKKRSILCGLLFPCFIIIFLLFQAALFFEWFHEVQPVEYIIGNYRWTASGQISQSLSTMLLFFARYFILARLRPNHLAILKAPIISIKKPKPIVDTYRRILNSSTT